MAAAKKKPARAKQTPAKRAKSTTSAVAKKSTTKQSAAKKSAAKKASAKKSAAKKAAAKKTAVNKTAVKAPATLARYQRKRDFTRTDEPSGSRPVAPRRKRLRFVIQKHAASHLHFDWRLELDGVMKSWAVPKGPSLVPGQRRLAMEVEDHPIAYNTFEGTIPKGEYGGGTVMLWDRGWYEHTGEGGAEALRDGYARGKLDVTLHGERLEGAFTMVRTGDATGERSQWLLMKRTDEHADRERDLVAEVTTSIASGRTMEELARGGRMWRSNRARSED